MVTHPLGMVCIKEECHLYSSDKPEDQNKRINVSVMNILDEKTKETHEAKETEVILQDLQKYTNYTLQVLAFTGGGDGVKCEPISCHTEQDGESKNVFSPL